MPTSPSISLSPKTLTVLAALLGLMLLLAWQLWFLCDDAFITFRYVSNAHAGHGLVWNAPPFEPVEGYTGFSWALLLWACWSWFGIEPPDSVTTLSLLFGVMTFVVMAKCALRMGASLWVSALVLLAIVGNRTFVQWQTSGLETPLFVFAFVSWALLAFADRTRLTRWMLLWSTAAAIAALTRPDGLLLVAATAATAVMMVVQRARWRDLAIGALPLLAVVAHVVWRRMTYGEWLPNTYFAKVTEAWPEAGMKYLSCFVVEHGTWVLPPVALLWLIVEFSRGGGAFVRKCWLSMPAMAAVSAVVFHAGYYVLRVGGDHFEYRVLCQVVPLSVFAVAAMAMRIANGARPVIVAVGLMLLGSSIGWLHLGITSAQPVSTFRPVAASMPAFLQPLARWYDSQQAWLNLRAICIRCDRHAQVLDEFELTFPRRLPIEADANDLPMFASPTVGLCGWALPDCAILDLHGLNDWVIARTPIPPGPLVAFEPQVDGLVEGADLDKDGALDDGELRLMLATVTNGPADGEVVSYYAMMLQTIHGAEPDRLTIEEAAAALRESVIGHRFMAHERHPPPGYVPAFAPNVNVVAGEVAVTPRPEPLTADRVRNLERIWRERVPR